MSTLEQEVIEKFQQLDKEAQQHVRALINQESNSPQVDATFDYDNWFRDVERLRQEIRASQSDILSSTDIVTLLRDIREGDCS